MPRVARVRREEVLSRMNMVAFMVLGLGAGRFGKGLRLKVFGVEVWGLGLPEGFSGCRLSRRVFIKIQIEIVQCGSYIGFRQPWQSPETPSCYWAPGHLLGEGSTLPAPEAPNASTLNPNSWEWRNLPSATS